VAQLGGTSFVIQPGAGSWQLEFADGTVMDGAAQEHIREAIPVLAGYADVLAVRRFADQTSHTDDLHDAHMRQMAELSSKPFINMESASDHPCQALADWKTLDDLNIPSDGGKFVLSWAYHPKPLPFAVPAAALRMAAQRGMEVTVLRPDGFDLPEPIVREAERLSSKRIVQTSDRDEAMEGAHVLYCKSWTSASAYGDADADARLKAGLQDWCVDEPWFEAALPNAKFMHCLPVRRNVKVTDRVLDGPRSVVLKQAQNRLHVQKAVLTALAGGSHAQ
jgi:N-acetylornithine carbamoyltransferase